MTPAPRLPRDVSLGLVAGVAVGLLGLVFAPTDTTRFYNAAVQIIPVFLVALALERSLIETLGTESSAIEEELARVQMDYTPPSSVTRIYFGIEGRLVGLPDVPLEEARAVQLDREYGEHDDASLWRALTPLSEEPEHAEFEHLVEVLAWRALSRDQSAASPVSNRRLVDQWEHLFTGFSARARERAEDEIRFEARARYRSKFSDQRRAVLGAILVLALAEALSFVGLLSPGAAYPGLFATTAAFVAASFIASTLGAVRQLVERPLDIQSAGLDWTDEPEPGQTAAEQRWSFRAGPREADANLREDEG